MRELTEELHLREQPILSLQEQLRSLGASSSELHHHKQPDLHRHQPIKNNVQ